MFCNNHSPKVHRFELGADGRTDDSIALCSAIVGGDMMKCICWFCMDDLQGSVGQIPGHQFYNHNNNYYSPSAVGVANSHLNHSPSSSSGYHGDSRCSLQDADGSAATVDVGDLLRHGYAVSRRTDLRYTHGEIRSSVYWPIV